MNFRVFLAVFFCATTAWAEPPVQDIPPGQDKIVPIAPGQPAPFGGQLYDPPTALRWANWLVQYKLRLASDVKLEQDKCSAETTYRDKLLEAEKSRAAYVEKDLRERLQRAEEARAKAEQDALSTPWYKTAWFGLGVGVAGTLAVTSLSVWVMHETK